MIETFDFSKALELMKHWKKLSRLQFRDSCYIRAMLLGTNHLDWNTLPYLQMIKWDERFPVDLSCESIFAEDRYIYK